MLLKTHLAIAVFAIILFFPVVNNPLIFSVMVLVATIIPDLDTRFTKIGNLAFSKIVQVFTNHRGVIHSLTFAIFISLFFAIFIPVIAFGFFLGYSLHLIADSFTKMGITPFWPYSKKAAGTLNSGGVAERGIFFTFVLVDILLFLSKVF
ncbi:MAG: metal-dependent hydrolase [Candidatus Pacearchaeota archaeon]